MQEEIQGQTAEQFKNVKKKYDKPVVVKIMLFADQVLLDCDPNINGGDGAMLSF